MPDHPAKFSASVLSAIKEITRRRIKKGEFVLDPFGGTGRIHDLADEMGWKSAAVEIEPEWAAMHPRTKQGDSTKLTKMAWLKRLVTRYFGIAAVITSVCYGNRMADHHNAKERCKSCGGSGKVPLGDPRGTGIWPIEATEQDCARCGGHGRNKYKRLTYKHRLDRRDPETGEVMDLHPRNTGQMHFKEGECEYKAVHALVWAEVAALKPRWIILNVSDFYAGDNPDGTPHRMEVSQWHVDRLAMHGYHEVERIEVATPRMGFGQNRDKRVEHEYVIALRRK